MEKASRCASPQSSSSTKPRRTRDSRGAVPLSDAQLLDIEQLSDIAHRKGWYAFDYDPRTHFIKVTLPHDRRAPRGQREAARPPPTPAPSATTATAQNARERASRERLQDFQQRKARERKGGTADAADVASPKRKKPLLTRLIEKVWSPSPTQDEVPETPAVHAEPSVPAPAEPSHAPAPSVPSEAPEPAPAPAVPVETVEPEHAAGTKREAALAGDDPSAGTSEGSCEKQRGKTGRGGGLLRKPKRLIFKHDGSSSEGLTVSELRAARRLEKVCPRSFQANCPSCDLDVTGHVPITGEWQSLEFVNVICPGCHDTFRIDAPLKGTWGETPAVVPESWLDHDDGGIASF